jgi:hypothetical protein
MCCVLQSTDKAISLEADVTSAAYLSMLQDNNVPSNNNVFCRKCYFQQDGTPLLYHEGATKFFVFLFSQKMDRVLGKGGVSTPVSWLNILTLRPVLYSKVHCVSWKTKNTAGSETLKLLVRPSHYKQYKRAIALHIVVNNALPRW